MKRLLVEYRAAELVRAKRARKPKILAPPPSPQDDTTCFCLDIYHRHAIEKTIHTRTICSPHLPDGDWDEIYFRTGPKLMSGELALDLLQECAALAEKCGAKLVVDYLGREADRNSLIRKVLGKDARKRSFEARYAASVPGGPKLELLSLPGCFCHRRTDEGGLALAETIAATLTHDTESGGEHAAESGLAPLKLLDMGCGNGLVGFLVASVLPSVELVMVDSHSRAIEAALANSRKLNIPAETILADNGTPARMDGTFDIFAGNPPYYSEYRIAELFCETALRALKPGGRCFMVCKNAAGLESVMKKYFPEIEITSRRSYAILRATRP